MKKLLALLAALALTSAVMAQAPDDTYVFDSIGGGGPVTAIPARTYDSASAEIMEQVYETLYTYDGEAVDEFVPGLATGYTLSEDGTSYTFTLRDGVQFHSGNTFSCKDVEYSFEFGSLVAHPQGAFAYLLGNQFVGTQTDASDPEAFEAEVPFSAIDGIVECPDGPEGLTAVVNLTAPDPAFIAVQAYIGVGAMIDSDWFKANGFWDGTEATRSDWTGFEFTESDLNFMTSGTGAYELVSTDEEQSVLRRFDGYWDGAPALANAVWRYVDEDSTRLLNIQQGSADRIVGIDRAQLVQLEGAEGVSILENEDWVGTVVSAGFFTFDINTEANDLIGSGQLDGNGIPPNFFQDVNVRRAFAHLFDQEGFIEQIHDGQGRALTMAVPPAFAGYNSDVPVRLLDLEAAEQYLRDAWDGAVWENGFEFTAYYNATNNTRQTFLEIIADNLSFINPDFRMNVQSAPWGDFLDLSLTSTMPLFALGWGADYADARNFVGPFYDVNGYFAPWTQIAAAEMTELQSVIDQAKATLDPVARSFLFEEIGVLHYDLAPVIPLPQATPFMIVRSDLQGVYRNPMLSSDFLVKDVSK